MASKFLEIASKWLPIFLLFLCVNLEKNVHPNAFGSSLLPSYYPPYSTNDLMTYLLRISPTSYFQNFFFFAMVKTDSGFEASTSNLDWHPDRFFFR